MGGEGGPERVRVKRRKEATIKVQGEGSPERVRVKRRKEATIKVRGEGGPERVRVKKRKEKETMTLNAKAKERMEETATEIMLMAWMPPPTTSYGVLILL